MPQTYHVKLSDGREFNVTTEGGAPSEADVLSNLSTPPPLNMVSSNEPGTFSGGAIKSLQDTVAKTGAGIASGLNPLSALKIIWEHRNDAALPYKTSDTPESAVARIKANDVTNEGLPNLSDPETGGRAIGNLIQAAVLGRALPFAAGKVANLVSAAKKADLGPELAKMAIGYRGARAITVAQKLKDAIRATAETSPSATTALSDAELIKQEVEAGRLPRSVIDLAAERAQSAAKPIVQAASEVHAAATASKVKLTLAEFQEASRLVQKGMTKEKALDSITAQRAFLQKFKGLPSTQAAADEVAARP